MLQAANAKKNILSLPINILLGPVLGNLSEKYENVSIHRYQALSRYARPGARKARAHRLTWPGEHHVRVDELEFPVSH